MKHDLKSIILLSHLAYTSPLIVTCLLWAGAVDAKSHHSASEALRHKAAQRNNSERKAEPDATRSRKSPSNSSTKAHTAGVTRPSSYNARGLPQARRRAKLDPNIRRAVALNYRGTPMRTRRFVSVIRPKSLPGETLRSLAYRYCTSPKTLASLNQMVWQGTNEILPTGTTLKVPVRHRAASGFAQAERLMTGPGVLVKRPHTSWGRPYVVRLLRQAFQQMHNQWPWRHPFVVHDLSAFGGGKLRPHKSHRAGLDIDIGYPTYEADRTHWGRPNLAEIDYVRLWHFVDGLEKTGHLAALYMHPYIQIRLHREAQRQGASAKRLDSLFQYPCAKGQKRTLIRFARGHRDHMHLRFSTIEDLPDLRS